MKKLADDPVPNIRFNFAKTAAILHPKLTNSSKMTCSDLLKRLAENDSDFDVKYFSIKAAQKF